MSDELWQDLFGGSGQHLYSQLCRLILEHAGDADSFPRSYLRDSFERLVNKPVGSRRDSATNASRGLKSSKRLQHQLYRLEQVGLILRAGDRVLILDRDRLTLASRL